MGEGRLAYISARVNTIAPRRLRLRWSLLRKEGGERVEKWKRGVCDVIVVGSIDSYGAFWVGARPEATPSAPSGIGIHEAIAMASRRNTDPELMRKISCLVFRYDV